MKRFGLLVALLLGFLAPAQAQAPATAPLILISIDAFRADYINRGKTPALAALAADGVHATAMHPSFPSLTYPNHYTLVTGLVPDHHGVVNNNMVDTRVSPIRFGMDAVVAEDPRWWEGGTPLWTTAMEAGRIVASAGWPGSEGIIHKRRANYLDPWRSGRTPDEVASVALNWFDLPAPMRPALEFLYMDDVDHAGHDYGPDSPELNAALTKVDAAIAKLVAGLKARGFYERTNIVLVSDHGMTGTDNSRVVLLDHFISAANAIPRALGAVAGIDPLPGHEAQVAKALVGRREHATCWKKQDMPARFHYGTNYRVPAIVCLADEGWLIETKSEVAKWNKPHPGNHGFDPALPNMQALFLAHGPAFAKGVTLKPFDNVDVYPLLARITGLKPEKNDGKLAEISAALAH